MSTGRRLTRDEAMIWLNDRLGQPAAVYVELDRGDYDRSVLSAESGMLQHWRADKPRAVAWTAYTRDDIAGLYDIGDVAVDLSDIDCPMSLTPPNPPELVESAINAGLGTPGEALIIQLDEHVVMRLFVYEATLDG
jgi:hypothetical protein